MARAPRRKGDHKYQRATGDFFRYLYSLSVHDKLCTGKFVTWVKNENEKSMSGFESERYNRRSNRWKALSKS